MTLSVHKSVKRWGLYIPKWFGTAAEECDCSNRVVSMPSSHPCSPKFVPSGSLDSPYDQTVLQLLSNDDIDCVSSEGQWQTKVNSFDRLCDNFSDFCQQNAILNSSVESLSTNITIISDVCIDAMVMDEASDRDKNLDMQEADYCGDITHFTQPNWGNEEKKEVDPKSVTFSSVDTTDAACQTHERISHESFNDFEESSHHSVDMKTLNNSTGVIHSVYSELLAVHDENISVEPYKMINQCFQNTISDNLLTSRQQGSPQMRSKSQSTSNLVIRIPDEDWTICDGIASRAKMVTPNIYTTPNRSFQNSEHIYKELFQKGIDESSDTDTHTDADDIYESIFEVLASKTEKPVNKEDNISHKVSPNKGTQFIENNISFQSLI